MIKDNVIKQVEAIQKSGTVYIKNIYGGQIEIKKSAVIIFGEKNLLTPTGDSQWYNEIENISATKLLNVYKVEAAIGSDPELFFVRGDEVVPSKLVVPAGGSGGVIRDGFQGELNPSANGCRQTAGSNIANAFLEAVRLAREAGTEVSMKIGHRMPDSVWKSTPMAMRRFGCNPTENAHELRFHRVTGLRERFRAAGGHIHIGLSRGTMNDPAKLVSIMDIVAGNTCVLVDRDPDNAERRKNYGRAGEYRIKPYGIEYRVLSNFWLKSYTLWSMASVLVRNAASIYSVGFADELLARFDMAKVRKAINTNDFELAKENFLILSDFLKEKKAYGHGLNAARVDRFFRWATQKADPLAQWDTLDKTINSWENKRHQSGVGFESFIDYK